MKFFAGKISAWLFCAVVVAAQAQNQAAKTGPTTDNGEWFVLAKDDLVGGAHHTRHAEIFGKYVKGYNYYALQAIDKVQATAIDGGGYFTGIKAVPTESPIGYKLTLFDRPLLDPPRTTSYCSGSTYAAFIEQLNLLFPGQGEKLSYDRYESIRMQEEDGGRREDTIKFWGKWNDDGFGSHYAMVQYAKMGVEIAPRPPRRLYEHFLEKGPRPFGGVSRLVQR